jgi:hypothetical protein
MAGKIESWRVDLAMLQVIPDQGCPVSPKCVDCTLPQCIYELPRKVRSAVLDQYSKRPQ